MKWNAITKEKLSYIFAAVTLGTGFGLTIAGFCVPPTGEIHTTVLTVLGLTMIFAGAIIGINLSLKDGFISIHKEIEKQIDRRMQDNDANRNCTQ